MQFYWFQSFKSYNLPLVQNSRNLRTKRNICQKNCIFDVNDLNYYDVYRSFDDKVQNMEQNKYCDLIVFNSSMKRYLWLTLYLVWFYKIETRIKINNANAGDQTIGKGLWKAWTMHCKKTFHRHSLLHPFYWILRNRFS